MSSNSEVTIDVRELGVSDHAVNLFLDRYYRDAIRHEAQDLLQELKERTQDVGMKEFDLVERTFRDKDPPFAFNERSTPQERDEHAAFRLLFLGVTRGVRNVYAHDVRREVSQLDAFIWLGLLGRLRRQLAMVYSVAHAEFDEPTESVG